MTPKRPFLLRAFYEWILDNDMTPHILVNATLDDVTVPRQHIKDGRIVLNISPMSVQDFIMDNEAVSFSARFGGVAFYVYCPVYSILAIYSRETQDGASFPEDEYAHLQLASGDSKEKAPVVSLTAVSNREETADSRVAEDDSKGDHDEPPPSGSGGDRKPAAAGKKSRPALRVVK